ncbi:SPOR domain-containing protein [Methylobacterium pseudosasicola]|uniref:Cell division protein DedD (Protein involved in septation) n=1 Tax=Methylobacterium pseudosasicola TaxID=582667 RepID=A0A1I4L3U1_9HYPH|nr:SPOR domain-containing protein [Methylobacterium pseudosasicola]SFL85546.1 Cell division protein DedD (protein involved in septation) [Methylobacterium pseudosasicola]
MTNASRAQVDLDALARDLRQDQARGNAGGAKPDPLAELARIVGQDDPFRALLAARDEMRSVAAAHPEAGWNARVEPSFAPEPAKPNPADAFDQYLASVERDTHEEPVAYGAETQQDPAASDYEDGRSLRRVNPRRRLASVGAGIAIVAVAVTGALTYKGLQGSGSGGGVPVVQADSTPLKVAPKVADGVEIPDQNRQIYDNNKGKPKDGQIKIVNREEQPIDVAEAARAAQGTGPAGGVQSGTTPGNGPFEAFGEPRRVRTVAVKPEAPPAAPQREAQADAGPAPIPTMVLPTDEPPQQTKPKPTRQAAASLPPPAPEPVQAPPPAVAEAAPPKPVAVKPPPKAVQRVATVATAAQEAPDAVDDTVKTGSVGGFSVQLGVRGSASEAKAALAQMQAKYSQLAGKPELIRQAEVNGKTIFRVRVGPLAKNEASSLCSALQGAGGQCFVAKN